MSKSLVIVESPAKAKTIKKFLGANFDVRASMGHIRDLPKKSLGIDVEHDFKPKYINIRGKGKNLQALKKAAEKASAIYLAPDPDREGEAIAWHLQNFLANGAERAVHRVQTLEHRTRRGAAWTGRRTGKPELRVQLGVAGLEHADERAVGQRRADSLNLGELLAVPENLEERRGLPLDLPVRKDLGEDDRPGGDREEDQDYEDDEVDRSGMGQNLDNLASSPGRSGSAVLHLKCKNERAKRVQRSLRRSDERRWEGADD